MYRKFEPKARRPVQLPVLRGSLRPDIDALKKSLAAGVQVVSAPQLFPTPPHVAEQMLDLLGVESGHRVLEPSAGTGALLDALDAIVYNPGGLSRTEVVAVEINPSLAQRLRVKFPGIRVAQCDFLEFGGGAFDSILMNPPFEKGSDIKHIKHALTMLRPGGCLVAICANGPRQQEQLKPLTDYWEVLPRDTFAGTGVSAAVLRVR